MTEPLLHLDGVNSFYGTSQALFDIDLRVNPGEIVCLLGGNASGKSTTMKTVLGLVTPSTGRVLFDGQDVTGWNTGRRISAGLASVPEARRVFGDMTVEENLLTGAFVRRDKNIRASLAEMYEAFPRLAERKKQRAGTMSGGEQQMLAFGRALMSNPRLICMDEPTMGLAPIIVDQVLEMITDINQRLGVSVLIVEQNAELSLSIANRGYVLRTGHIAISGSAQDLLDDPTVREAYLGSTAVTGAAASAPSHVPASAPAPAPETKDQS